MEIDGNIGIDDGLFRQRHIVDQVVVVSLGGQRGRACPRLPGVDGFVTLHSGAVSSVAQVLVIGHSADTAGDISVQIGIELALLQQHIFTVVVLNKGQMGLGCVLGEGLAAIGGNLHGCAGNQILHIYSAVSNHLQAVGLGSGALVDGQSIAL